MAFSRLMAWSKFASDWLRFRRQMRLCGDRRFQLRFRDRHPSFSDDTSATLFDRHYVYHVAWAVRFLIQHRPAKHVDVSSSLSFASTLSAIMPTDFYDYRPADLFLSDLRCEKADLLNLPFGDATVESLSCLHVLEHIGLGRYGDQVDPLGDIKAVAELKRVVKPGGWLLVAVPVGKQRICFNAHRIYDWYQWIEQFQGFALYDNALIPDDGNDGGLVRDPSLHLLEKQSYACGCFAFKKEM